MDKTFGGRIKKLRVKANLTQVELASKLGYTPQTVSYWESGSREPDIEALSKISSTLGVSIDYLISGKTDFKLSLDDMDDAKRLAYVVGKDDLDNFKKYDYKQRFFLKDWRNYDGYTNHHVIKSELWELVFKAKAQKIFKSLCLYMEQLNKPAVMAGGWVYPVIDDFVKMVVDIDYAPALETIGFHFFAIQEDGKPNSLKKNGFVKRDPLPNPYHNDAGVDVGKKNWTIQIEPSTLEYIFAHRKDSPKCYEYASTLQFTIQNPNRNGERRYAITFLENDIVRLAFKYRCFDTIEDILEVYKAEDENACKKIPLRYDVCGHITGSYIYSREFINARILSFPLDVIIDLIKAGEPELAKKLNDFNKTPILYKREADLSVERKYERPCEYLSDNEFSRLTISNSQLSDKERAYLSCINEHILVVKEIENLKDLKLAKEIIDAGYYNYYEFAYDMLAKGQPGELFRFFVDHDFEDLARLLMKGPSTYPTVLRRVFDYFDTMEKRKPRKDIYREGKESIVEKQNELYENCGNTWNFSNGEIIDYLKESEKIGPNRLIDLIHEKKETFFQSLVKSVDRQKAEAKLKAQKAKDVEGLTFGEFEKLLAKKSILARNKKREFVVELCMILEASFKCDYQCDGEDFRECMDSYFKKLKGGKLPIKCLSSLPVELPGVSTSVSDADRIKYMEGLLNRLRMERNRLVHSDSERNQAEPLNKNELRQCLDYVFAIRKEEK